MSTPSNSISSRKNELDANVEESDFENLETPSYDLPGKTEIGIFSFKKLCFLCLLVVGIVGVFSLISNESNKNKVDIEYTEEEEEILIPDMLPETVIETEEVMIDEIVDPVCVKVEEKAKFPGGDKEFDKFIADNFQYPSRHSDKKTSGSALVSFTVNKDGSIQDPKILRSTNTDYDEEIIRLVKLMPKWKAARNHNRIVRSEVIQNIRY